MPGPILTGARIKALLPLGIAFDIRDGNPRGFGVRMSPSGRKRCFVRSCHHGEGFRKIVRDPETTGVDETRSCALRTPGGERASPAISGRTGGDRMNPTRMSGSTSGTGGGGVNRSAPRLVCDARGLLQVKTLCSPAQAFKCRYASPRVF